MEVSGQFHAPAAYPWGKSARNPLDKRLGGAPAMEKRKLSSKIWGFHSGGYEEYHLGYDAV
jgi:hypothetical protein